MVTLSTWVPDGILIAGTGNFVEAYNATPSTYTGTLIPAYISGNTGNGITLTGSGNTVTGNYFGYAALITGGAPVPNQACNSGVSIFGSSGNTVSANNTGMGFFDYYKSLYDAKEAKQAGATR